MKDSFSAVCRFVSSGLRTTAWGVGSGGGGGAPQDVSVCASQLYPQLLEWARADLRNKWKLRLQR